jgi:hypothetical protein
MRSRVLQIGWYLTVPSDAGWSCPMYDILSAKIDFIYALQSSVIIKVKLDASYSIHQEVTANITLK